MYIPSSPPFSSRLLLALWCATCTCTVKYWVKSLDHFVPMGLEILSCHLLKG